MDFLVCFQLFDKENFPILEVHLKIHEVPSPEP